MENERTIYVNANEESHIARWLESNDEDDHLSEDDTFTKTAVFSDGFEIDIKCCGSDDGAAWAEAVLFHNGYECCCSEPEEEFLGDWVLEYNNDVFIVHVETEEVK